MSVRTVDPSQVSSFFAALTDPRDVRNRKHLLVDVLVIAVCAPIVGCDGPTAMARWARAQADWLGQFLELPNGIPSRDCLRRILAAVRPTAFQQCFHEWIASLALPEVPDGPTIAIDGKTNRRSHDRGADLGPLHLVSAWATEHGVALGQVATAAKSNEITAIPELLAHLDVQDAVVTIDAMGCQKEIAAQIVAQGGDYVLAVKDNQPTLHTAVQAALADHFTKGSAAKEHCAQQTEARGHGRIEERYYDLLPLPEDFPAALRDQWPSIQAIGSAVRLTTQADGTTTEEIRYYILSRYCSGERFVRAVRGHWGIENKLHWVLDMNFREDENRTRERTLGNNLSWLRRFAITLLKQHPSKDSIKGKMQRAGWDNAFLTQVIVGSLT